MIIDTGILFAAADRADGWHAQASEVLSRRDVRIVPEPVLVETDYLIRRRLGVEAELVFLSAPADGSIEVECPEPADRARAVELIGQYRDADIGYVDAIIVAIAERLGETRIATVNRRDFAMIRPRHVEAFELLP